MKVKVCDTESECRQLRIIEACLQNSLICSSFSLLRRRYVLVLVDYGGGGSYTGNKDS